MMTNSKSPYAMSFQELLFRIEDLEKQNAALVDALKAAPPLPMKSNIDFWYGVYDEWRDKALALVEGEQNGR